ncbi:MAG TPA: LysR family transcriptional regulator [Dissulfurispiraceae bacterium]|nr:LysR family transcriptional regulator [Dissulfurispiraceae bacterium]
MNFYQLVYFKKVSETNSVSRAAEELLITQPAVSKQIKALEDELGERLFDRIGKKVYLTRTGSVLYSHADRILRLIEEAKTAVRDMSVECSGELVIGTSDHISIHRLPKVLKTFIHAFPKVDLKLRCHRSETILDMVNRNLVDIGVITLPGPAPHLVTKTIWKDPMSVVFMKNHPLVSIRGPRLRDIAKYGMILTEAGTETRKMIDAAFSRKGLAPNIAMEVAYLETVKSLVRTGLGISVLPDKAVEMEVKSGVLVKSRVAEAIFSRELGVVYLKGKFLSRPVREFLKMLNRE